MAKRSSTVFVCSSCGYESGTWYGKCPECGEWNTLKEFSIPSELRAKSKEQRFGSTLESAPKKISNVEISSTVRVSTGFSEFDRVLGEEEKAGIVPGSVILLSGDPGVGKSTLLLQTALKLASAGSVALSPESDVLARKLPAGARRGSPTAHHPLAKVSSQQPETSSRVLYVTGEESEAQVTLRAQRLLGKGKKLEDLDLFILATSNIDEALIHAENEKYQLVIIDSIQTMEGENLPGYAGSIPQVRHATARLVTFAKGTGTPVMIIGHVTKEGMVAGPQMLSHMVDTVLYLEGEKMTGVRILRAFKNRFGDTSEVGIFTMQEYGLKEVTDLSELFLGEEAKTPGSCAAVVLEGSRPIIAEIQALVVSSNLPYPRRVASGISEKRLELLLAILQKHAHLPLDRLDVFINVVGGFKITEPAADLATCLAIFSSLKGKSFVKTVAIGEVGLLGEVKKVMQLEKRVKEAKKFGFKVVSVENAKSISQLLKEK